MTGRLCVASNNYPRAKHILSALIQGVYPDTGGELPPDTILHRVDVVRALLAGVAAIEHVTAREPRRALLPSSVGKQWTDGEVQKLKGAFANGDTIPDIAHRHNRTVRAIEARLERMGLLTAEQRTTSNSFTGGPIAAEATREQTEYPSEVSIRFREYVAAYIQDYRHNHSMSYAGFARKSGLSAQRVARIETACYELYSRDLLKIAAVPGATTLLLTPVVGLQGAVQPA